MRPVRGTPPEAASKGPAGLPTAIPRLRRLAFLCLLGTAAWTSAGLAENIDPDGRDARYAWAENVGWFNARPLGPGGPGLQIDDFEVTGWIFGENIGWVSASCKNTMSCDRVRYGVRHDGAGNLFGEAWAENLGWIIFAPTIGGAPVAGVTIDPFTGEFAGEAWLENAGWLSFGLGDFGLSPIRTAWTCDPGAPPPAGTPLLQVDQVGGEEALLVSGAGDASGHDLVVGDLGLLRSTGGDYRAATEDCLADDSAFDSEIHVGEPGLGQGIWFIARGVTCSGAGSYDAPAGGGGASSQVGSRDPGIGASAAGCP
jgi:hypothetical protein